MSLKYKNPDNRVIQQIAGDLDLWISFQSGQEDAFLNKCKSSSKSLKLSMLFYLFAASQLSLHKITKHYHTDWGRYFWASGLLSCFSGTIIIVIIAVMGLLFCLSDSIWPISPRQEVLHYYFSPLYSHETMSGRGIC